MTMISWARQISRPTTMMNGMCLEYRGDSVYPQWRCYTYYFFVDKSYGYVQAAMRISRVLRRMIDFHVGDWS